MYICNNEMLIKFVLLFCLSLAYAYCAETQTTDFQTEKRFKIGFEFQEIHHLCPWASAEKCVQNEPIFRVSKNGSPLWHITIDWEDLEFVTEPFSNLEEDLCDAAIETIQIACAVLSQLSLNSTKIGDVTFKKWRTHLQTELERIHEALYTIDFTYVGNADSFGSIIFSNPGSKFLVNFQPQVTIQHSLSYTIPLVLGLCASSLLMQDDFYCLDIDTVEDPRIVDIIKHCFPDKINESGQFIVSKHTLSEEGFLFLHMLICLSLVSNVDIHQTDQDRVSEVVDWHYKGGQVNAKAHLGVLSRRPFSMMWGDIKTQQSIGSLLSTTSSIGMLDLTERTTQSVGLCAYESKQCREEAVGTGFSTSLSRDVSYAGFVTQHINIDFAERLAQRFQWINYADIYFTQDGRRRNITSHFPELGDEGSCTLLLENGIVSTSMIRESYVKKRSNGEVVTMDNIFTHYFDEIIRSIDTPSLQRYMFDEVTMDIQPKSVLYDLLSPPHFLSEHDSMGAYKDSTKIELEFGEAILEFRMIPHIGKYAREKIKELLELDDSIFKIKAGEFLTYIHQGEFSTLQYQTKGLFLFIKSLFDLGEADEA